MEEDKIELLEKKCYKLSDKIIAHDITTDDELKAELEKDFNSEEISYIAGQFLVKVTLERLIQKNDKATDELNSKQDMMFG